MTASSGKTRGFLASLTSRDRILLLACGGIIVLLTVVIALLAPQEDDDNPVPSSFSSSSHGSEAAFLALQRSGYRIERWQQPLDDLASQSDAHTVLVLAEPFSGGASAAKPAIAKILARGGRVIATGITSGLLLPDSHIDDSSGVPESTCFAQPSDAALGTSPIQIRPVAHWSAKSGQVIAYTCKNSLVVVSYTVGKGTVVWWADSLPLENAAIAKDGDLALLLASIGPDKNAHVYWDESLHENTRGLWSYAEGTPVRLLWLQLALVAFLLIFSFSRRSGPLLPDPIVARDTQLEFVHSLGALYDKANATNTAVQIAYDRFLFSFGQQFRAKARRAAVDRTEEMVSIIQSRAGHPLSGLHDTIVDCEDLAHGADQMPATAALATIQQLWAYDQEIRTVAGNKVKGEESGE